MIWSLVEAPVSNPAGEQVFFPLLVDCTFIEHESSYILLISETVIQKKKSLQEGESLISFDH